MRPSTRNDLCQLHERLAARRSELEQSIDARIAAIPGPPRALDPRYVTGRLAALAAGLDYGLDAIAAPGRVDPVPVELLGQARLAARNGVGLDAVLRRYSAGHTLLATAVLEEAATLGLGARQLRPALRALAARYDRVVSAVSEEYRHENAAQLENSAERSRLELVRRLLAGEPLDPSSLGYELDAHHIALVAYGAPEVFSGFGACIDRVMLAAEPDSQVAWIWLGGRRPFTDEELEFISTYCWPDGCVVACGEAGEGLGGWRLSHRQAAAALPIAQLCSETLVHYRDVAVLAATLQDDLLGISLRRAYLAPLESLREGGEPVKETLRAYFAAGRNVSSAAAALGVSRRTVAARLARVEKRLGRPLEAVAAELEIALRLDALTQPPENGSFSSG